MSGLRRRGITRGETWLIVAGIAGLCAASLIFSWAMIALVTGVFPVSTPGVPVLAGPVLVVLCVVLLVWVLWVQALRLLRGDVRLRLDALFVVALGSYMLWSVGGSIAGMSVADTWLSLFVVALLGIWCSGVVLAWALLLHRLYGAQRELLWPWQRRGESDAEETLR